MPGFKLALTLAAAVYAVGKYAVGQYVSGFVKKDDDDEPPPSPPRDSYHSFNTNTRWNQTQQSHKPPPPHDSVDSFNSGTWNETQQSYKPPPPRDLYHSFNSGTWNRTQQSNKPLPPPPPPPPPSYPYRTSTNARGLTPSRTPALPDYGQGVYHTSIAYGRTPSQTQPSTRTRAYCPHCHRVHERPEYEYSDTDSDIPSLEDIKSETRLPTAPAVHRVHEQPEYDYYDSDSDVPPLEDIGIETRLPTAPAIRHVHERPKYDYYDSDSDVPPLEDIGSETRLATTPAVRRVHERPEYEYYDTDSDVPSLEDIGSKTRLPTAPQAVSSNGRFDEPAIVEDLDLAKKLREKAKRKKEELSEARKRAESAQKKRYGGGAQAHNREAIAHEKAMKELNKRAAKIIFTENNKNRKEGTVDLHGLRVVEAIQFAKDQVQAAQSRGDDVVRFIVGKGLHSDDGLAKIRPALEGYFTKRGLKHSLDPKNLGALIVRLD